MDHEDWESSQMCGNPLLGAQNLRDLGAKALGVEEEGIKWDMGDGEDKREAARDKDTKEMADRGRGKLRKIV